MTTAEPMAQELHSTLDGRFIGRDLVNHHCTLELDWTNRIPSQIALTVRAGDNQETWKVGRSLFITAALDWYRGAWAGGGDFALCYPKIHHQAMLAFKPTDRPAERAIVVVPAWNIEDFITHTTTIVAPGEAEYAINLSALDTALGRILESTDGQ